MRIIFIVFFLITSFKAIAQQQLPPLGHWREHLPYNSAIDIADGTDKVYCATPFSIFSVNKENEKERYSRITGLNETGISAIAFDKNKSKLFVAYSNSNIDIIYRNDIFNIPDIKRDNIIGNKTIYQIYPYQNKFYLSTGLGVIVIDADRYEVMDTWFIGNGGNQVRVNGFTNNAQYFFAATEEGLKAADMHSPNLADAGNWQLIKSGACQNVFEVNGKVLVQQNDTLFLQNGASWSLFYTDGWPIINTTESENNITICERQTNGMARVVILNTDGIVSRVIDNSGAVSFPRKAILINNDPWIADQYACLSHFTGNTYHQFVLNSPQNISSGEMVVGKNIFYATSGAVNDNWNYQYNGEGIYVLKDGGWNNINRYNYSALDSLLDFLCIAIDKRDETIWAGSYGGGLLHIKPGPQFEIFKQN